MGIRIINISYLSNLSLLDFVTPLPATVFVGRVVHWTVAEVFCTRDTENTGVKNTIMNSINGKKENPQD